MYAGLVVQRTTVKTLVGHRSQPVKLWTLIVWWSALSLLQQQTRQNGSLVLGNYRKHYDNLSAYIFLAASLLFALFFVELTACRNRERAPPCHMWQSGHYMNVFNLQCLQMLIRFATSCTGGRKTRNRSRSQRMWDCLSSASEESMHVM